MAKIIIVGLGFGDENALTLGVLKQLQSGGELWLRTVKHPVVAWLDQEGIPFQTFDSIYEEATDFETVYQEISLQLITRASKINTPILYAVPGHPMVAEQSVQLLLQSGEKNGVYVDVQGGNSFLDPAFTRLGIDPIEGFQLLDGNAFSPAYINPEGHVLIGQVYSSFVASEIKLNLMEIYPEDYEVKVVTALGIDGLEKMTTLPLYELDRVGHFTDLTSVYIPPVQEAEDLYRHFSYLEELIAYLRSPEGCPWDQKQTHDSLKPYLIEEVYEFLEAVHQEDDEAMSDELGDVLLQVMLHAQIAKEAGYFDVHDVIQRLNEKMVRRHPHVFAKHTEEPSSWDEIKIQERGGATPDSILDGIPKDSPMLLRSYELSKKAAKVGFDWQSINGVWAKVDEELKELQEAESLTHIEEEYGDLLFVMTSLARFLKINPEIALLHACKKFEARFGYVEDQVRVRDQDWADFTQDQLEQWWLEAKTKEKR
ncbi:nucleoside triphosphate pyrophosphohydrolase [Polycladospora coralii]|uniref:nucleoside triphosphate pyrophosphohydrolase n=1 Tax=Polycladospora coralii TaxID=2771432 RepID=UPI00321FF124